MTESLQYAALVGWLICVLVSTFLGYDRGRWFTGLWLGLCFGPFGVIAAGLILPAAAMAAQRQHEIDRRLSALRRQDERVARERRRARNDLDDFVGAIETQVGVIQERDQSVARSSGDAPPADNGDSGVSQLTASLSRLGGNGDVRVAGPAARSEDFSSRLRELASNLECLASAHPAHGDELRKWVRWLNVKADTARVLKHRSRTRVRG